MFRKSFSLCLVALLAVACQPRETVEVPVLPIARVAYNQEGEPAIVHHLDASRIVSELAERYDALYVPNFLNQDTYYVVVDHEWMLEFIKWWDYLKFTFGIQYLAEGFDCDNFADFVSIVADFSNKDIKAELLIGSISVKQREPFGGVPAGGYHALNFFVSDKGIFILEPQGKRSTVISLDKYPNVKDIFKIDL